MLREIELTEEQRAEIWRACADAVQLSERITEDAIPGARVKESVLGKRGLITFSIGWGIACGLISLVIWRGLIDWTGADDFMAGIGLPAWFILYLPFALAFWSTAHATAFPLLSESRETRYRLLTESCNAHARSSALHSVVEELIDLLPGAIPDMDDYAHSLDDERPSPLVERALGRREPPPERRTLRRREPPVSFHDKSPESGTRNS